MLRYDYRPICVYGRIIVLIHIETIIHHPYISSNICISANINSVLQKTIDVTMYLSVYWCEGRAVEVAPGPSPDCPAEARATRALGSAEIAIYTFEYESSSRARLAALLTCFYMRRHWPVTWKSSKIWNYFI